MPLPANKVVVHDQEGNLFKGTTADFLSKRPTFHLMVGGVEGGAVKEIYVASLKAIFFVKDFQGDPAYHEVKAFSERPVSGKKVKAVFKDGEIMVGYTHAINFDQPGFFMVPADTNSNNERIYAIFSAMTELEIDGRPIDLRKFQKR